MNSKYKILKYKSDKTIKIEDLISIEEMASTEPEASMMSSKNFDSTFSTVKKSKSFSLSPQPVARSNSGEMSANFIILFILIYEIRLNEAIFDEDGSFSLIGNLFLVGYNNYCLAFAVQFVQKTHDFFTGFWIKVTGGLIGKQYSRGINKSSRNCDSLLLSSG